MSVLANTPSLGVLIGGPITIIFLLIFLGVAAFAFLDSEPGIGWGSLGCALVTLLIAGIAYWPYDWQYHSFTPVKGEVAEVNKRLVPAGDNGMQEKVVIRLKDGRQFGITDTRAALLKPGDMVSIACKRAYEWASSDHGWDCRWSS